MRTQKRGISRDALVGIGQQAAREAEVVELGEAAVEAAGDVVEETREVTLAIMIH